MSESDTLARARVVIDGDAGAIVEANAERCRELADDGQRVGRARPALTGALCTTGMRSRQDTRRPIFFTFSRLSGQPHIRPNGQSPHGVGAARHRRRLFGRGGGGWWYHCETTPPRGAPTGTTVVA